MARPTRRGARMNARSATMTATDIGGRLAGAPISWGVCEAPGWGHELPPDRLLSEMCHLGLRALELGPIGYLGGSATEVFDRLSHHDRRLVGGFLPAALHVDPVLDLTPATAAIATLVGVEYASHIYAAARYSFQMTLMA